MDRFQTTARRGQLHATLVTGATFGIFLTLGNAWSVFLQTAIQAWMPAHLGVVTELVYALVATVVCVCLVLFLVRMEECIERTRMPIVRLVRAR